MKIAKEFKWEMGHRLPEHFGNCKNIHGHSYKMIIELEGAVDVSGMVMDYYDVKMIIEPIVDNLDHAFMVYKEDKEIISFLEKVKSKMLVVDFQSTVENICNYFLNEVKKVSLPQNIEKVTVRIYETSDDYAESSFRLKK